MPETLTLDTPVATAVRLSPRAHRIAVSALFFLLGLCFASWASRIPSIRQKLNLSDAELGIVLFALPVGSFISLLFSGWLVNKKGSRTVCLIAIILYAGALVGIGLPDTRLGLVLVLVLFGALGNTMNVAVNTQAVGVEALYGRTIMASFHGLWSLAGFVGAAIGTVMIGNNVIPLHHFLYVLGAVVIGTALVSRYTLREDPNRQTDVPLFVLPPKSLLHLGLIAFCSMMCEGAMFDWSGIYFEKVVRAEKSMIGAGYTAFMCTMATGRFIADWFTNRFGIKFTLQCSAALIVTGLLTAVLFPQTLPAIIGFLLVGFGVSSIVPLVYSLAGKSKNLSAGTALAAVTTIGFVGFLLGPPIIGLIAGATSLRLSFTFIAVMGLFVGVLATVKKLEPV